MYRGIAALVHEQEHNLRKVHISLQAAFSTVYVRDKFPNQGSLACNFALIKQFIFRYEVILIVGAACNRWFMSQSNVSQGISWYAMTTQETWSHEEVRSVIRLLWPRNVFSTKFTTN
jgi:hypothetical protein